MLGQFFGFGQSYRVASSLSPNVECLENVEDLQLDATCDDWPKPFSPELRIRRFQVQLLMGAPVTPTFVCSGFARVCGGKVFHRTIPRCHFAATFQTAAGLAGGFATAGLERAD